MGKQTHSDMMDWEPIHEEPPQKFAEPYQEDELFTIGVTVTEWITSDTTVEIRE